MRPLASILALVMILSPGCATQVAKQESGLVEAGRLVRREQAPPRAGELRREVDSFLENELPLMQEKVRRRLDGELKLWRTIAVGGAALAVLAVSSGTISSSGSGAKGALGAAGVVAALGGWAIHSVRTRDLKACKAYLWESGNDLAAWEAAAIPPGDGPVSVATWRAWVDRSASIRGAGACRAVR